MPKIVIKKNTSGNFFWNKWQFLAIFFLNVKFWAFFKTFKCQFSVRSGGAVCKCRVSVLNGSTGTREYVRRIHSPLWRSHYVWHRHQKTGLLQVTFEYSSQYWRYANYISSMQTFYYTLFTLTAVETYGVYYWLKKVLKSAGSFHSCY